jgi:hypothetical protein
MEIIFTIVFLAIIFWVVSTLLGKVTGFDRAVRRSTAKAQLRNNKEYWKVKAEDDARTARREQARNNARSEKWWRPQDLPAPPALPPPPVLPPLPRLLSRPVCPPSSRT